MSHVTRHLTPEQVWIARLFRSCCTRGKALNALENSLHLPSDRGIGVHSNHKMTSREDTGPRARARHESTGTEREKIAVPL